MILDNDITILEKLDPNSPITIDKLELLGWKRFNTTSYVYGRKTLINHDGNDFTWMNYMGWFLPVPKNIGEMIRFMKSVDEHNVLANPSILL